MELSSYAMPVMRSGLDIRLNPSHQRLNAQARRASSRLPTSLFQTSDLPAAERFAAWQASIGVFLQVRLLQPSDDEGFDAWAESYLIDDIMLSRCVAGRQKFDRRAIQIARDSIDHYMIQLLLDGTIDMTLGRRTLQHPRRHLIGFDLGEGMDTVNSKFDLISVIIPRRRLAHLLAKPDLLHATTIDPDSGTGILVANFIRALYQSAPRLSPAEASAAGASLLELLALAFNGVTFQSGDAPEAMAQAELVRVQTFIKANLASPELGPSTVVAALGISRARLYRLFAPIGGIAEYVREQRLRRCLADLVSSQLAHRQIAEIAYGWGFADPAHFARLFKQRFGRTPSEVRNAAPPLARRAAPSLDPRVGDRLHEDWLVGLA